MAANELSKACIKRLLADYKLITTSDNNVVDAVPDDNNMLIWYFLIIGPDDSDYAGGYYIGKIMHNPEYPMKAPDYMMLTPNGRFEIDKKICMTNTGYHSSEWSPMWNILTMLQGFVSIMLDDDEHGISHIKDSKANRKRMANNSMEFNRKNYLDIIKRFTRFIDEDGNARKKENILVVEKKEKKNKKDEMKIVDEVVNQVADNLVITPVAEQVNNQVTDNLVITPVAEQVNNQVTDNLVEQEKQEGQVPVKKQPVKRTYKKKQEEQEKQEKPEPEPEPVKKQPVKRTYKKKQEEPEPEPEPVKKQPVKRTYKKKQGEKEEQEEQEEQEKPEKKPVKRVYKKKQVEPEEPKEPEEPEEPKEPVEQEKPKRKYVRKTNK